MQSRRGFLRPAHVLPSGDSTVRLPFGQKKKIGVDMGVHSGSSLKKVKKDLMKIQGA
jgi:hypothetical protein